MFSSVERMIAFRYLLSKHKEGFIHIISMFSLIGITLGVATLIIVMSVMNGFSIEITKKILGFDGHIQVGSYKREMKDYNTLKEKLKNIEGVVSVVPIINGQVLAMNTANDSSSGVLLKGMKFEDLLGRSIVTNNIIKGDINSFKLKDTIIIGEGAARNLFVGIGDKIRLLSPSGNFTILGAVPRMKTYTIGAIFKSGMHSYDSKIFFIPLKSSQLFFKYKDSVSSIEIMTENPHTMDGVLKKVKESVGNIYRVFDWKESNSSLLGALKMESSVMFLILSLIVFIAAFNIVSSLIMLVNNKSNDIAILRTIGATKGMIIRTFFMCGASIGIFGSLLGFVIGLSIAINIENIRSFLENLLGRTLFDPTVYFLSELPSVVQFGDVLRAVLVGVVFSFIATLYPVWKSSKKDPSEVLRYG